MPLRLGNLKCGDTAGGAFCRDTRVSPSLYLWLCCRAQDRRNRRGETGEEGKERGVSYQSDMTLKESGSVGQGSRARPVV